MKGYSRRTVAVFAALVLLALNQTSTSANHAWGGYHGARTANPFTVKLGDNVSSAWDPYLSQASGDWSQSAVLDTAVVSGGSNGRNCRPTAGQDQICNGAYGNNGWLGVAQIWITGGVH